MSELFKVGQPFQLNFCNPYIEQDNQVLTFRIILAICIAILMLKSWVVRIIEDKCQFWRIGIEQEDEID